LFTRDNTYTNADVDAFCRALDDLLFEHDRMIDAMFEVKVGVVTAPRQSFREIRLQVTGRYVVFFKKDRVSSYWFHSQEFRSRELIPPRRECSSRDLNIVGQPGRRLLLKFAGCSRDTSAHSQSPIRTLEHGRGNVQFVHWSQMRRRNYP